MSLLFWIFHVVCGRHHGQLSHVLTIRKRTYQPAWNVAESFRICGS